MHLQSHLESTLMPLTNFNEYASTNLVQTEQYDFLVHQENLESGINGLSFCPNHKVCPDYQLDPYREIKRSNIYKHRCSMIRQNFDVFARTVEKKDHYGAVTDVNYFPAQHLLFIDNPYLYRSFCRTIFEEVDTFHSSIQDNSKLNAQYQLDMFNQFKEYIPNIE